MNQNKNFSLGGFPPIYEIVSNIKKKEYVTNNILSIHSILNKREINDKKGGKIQKNKTKNSKKSKK